MNVNAILALAGGLITPLIAVLAVLIAYRQYRVEYLNAKHNLFDRRFRVYQSTMAYVRAAATSDGIPEKITSDFIDARYEAQFLFSDDLNKVLREIYDRVCKIWVAERMRKETPPEQEMSYVYEIRDQQHWFSRADTSVIGAFRKYLSLA